MRDNNIIQRLARSTLDYEPVNVTGESAMHLLAETMALSKQLAEALLAPVPMLLWCPECGERHIDKDGFELKPHHTHACQHCGHVWRPAIEATCGVQFLPGFKNGGAS